MPFEHDYGDSTPQNNPEQDMNKLKRKPVDVELVTRLIDYDHETGVMTWRERPMSLFQSARVGKGWNTKYAGKTASGAKWSGYPTVCIFDDRYLAHRVAWAIFYQSQPPLILDHIDGDRANNRISNLRSVSASENAKNCSVRSDNKTGISGIWRISPKKNGKPWAVAMGGSERMEYRRHRTFCAALRHRNAYAKSLGCTARHGIGVRA